MNLVCLLFVIYVGLVIAKNVDVESLRIDLPSFGRSLIGTPSTDVGQSLTKWMQSSTRYGNAEEIGSYMEGDILFPNGQSRNGIRPEVFRWPNGHIPFEVRGKFSKSRVIVSLD